jgi:heme exporter protein CcmD
MPHFDKYGPYVYAGYGVALGMIVALIAWSILRAVAAKKKLDAAEGKPPAGEAKP